MAKRHALRSSGAAAGVQYQRDIVRAGFRRAATSRNLRRDQRNAGLLRRTPGIRALGAIRTWNHQHLRAGVRKVKAKLLEFVAWVQRRRRTRNRSRQKRDDGVQTI